MWPKVKTDASIEKLPPQGLEAEQSVLGAILIENDALLRALDVITAEDFYREAHRKIFKAMLDLFDRSEAIDLVTIAEQLRKNGELEDAGGPSYLASLASQTPTAANILYHSRILKEKSLMRALLKSATEIAGRVYENSHEADELLDYAEKSIFQISDRRVKGAFVPLRDVIKDSFKLIEDLYNRKDAITGMPSGFRDLDDLTSGFQRGDLIIVGGRPSMGKTAFGLNIVQHVGIEMKEPVAVFSLEMTIRQLVMRMLCSEAMVDANKVRKGFINPKGDHWHKLTSAAGRLYDAPIFIDDSASLGVLELRAKARRLKMDTAGLSLIVVDYLQLMRGKGSFDSREQEIADISRSLKALAKELDVPVIAMSQLNRGVEQRSDKRPSLANLRESGAIEQDADVIIFLYREDDRNKGVVKVNVAKQRNGPTDTINLAFLDYCTRFTDFTDGGFGPEEDTGPGVEDPF